MAENHTILR